MHYPSLYPSQWLALLTWPTSQQSRVASYASTDYEKLNDDQKRSLKTLPSLEAVYKELEDVKKSIEVCMIVEHPPTTMHSTRC